MWRQVFVSIFLCIICATIINGRGGSSRSSPSGRVSSGGRTSSSSSGRVTSNRGSHPSGPIVHHPVASSSNHKNRPFRVRANVGFSSYGNNYESNFHHSHFKPVSHPYQSYFQPQTSVFAYHFMPVTPITHVHHIHHHSSGSNQVYYDYRNDTNANADIKREPIVYVFKPPAKSNTSFASSEEFQQIDEMNPNDYFVMGVDNLLFYGMMKQNQHQVAFVLQDSDGISLESELLSLYDQNPNDQVDLQYLPFPDIEFRFDADDEPNDTDLENIREMYQKLIDNGNC